MNPYSPVRISPTHHGPGGRENRREGESMRDEEKDREEVEERAMEANKKEGE